MEEKEMLKFSWRIFFCVTAISFIIFCGALRFLDAPNSGLFLRIGLVIGGLGILSILSTYIGTKMSSKEPNISQEQEDLFGRL